MYMAVQAGPQRVMGVYKGAFPSVMGTWQCSFWIKQCAFRNVATQ